MPYITQEERDKLNHIIDQLHELCQGLRGRVNYCCTRLVHLWCLQRMAAIKSITKKYKIVNDAHGILNCIRDEFYNAVIVPYEKLKRKENGPVSLLDAFADGKTPKKYKCRACGHEFDVAKYVEISINYSRNGCPECSSTYEEII